MATTRLQDVFPERKHAMTEEARAVKVPERKPQVSLAECNKHFMKSMKGRTITGSPVNTTPEAAQAAIHAANQEAEGIVARAEAYASEHAETKITELTLEAAREMVAAADTSDEESSVSTDRAADEEEPVESN